MGACMLITCYQKIMLNMDSSPFQSSPFNASEGSSSPRLFWQGRDPGTPSRFVNSENGPFAQREISPSPTRRSSIERLQRASRVKNSNMFAREQKQEYDPTSVAVVERPLAKQVQGNAYGGSGLEGLRAEEQSRELSHSRFGSRATLCSPEPSPTKLVASSQLRSPNKEPTSPTKSSFSARFNHKASFDPEKGTWSEEGSSDDQVLPPGHSLHRHAKSVTFDAAPPQINEYEMTTPDISSIGNSSRENSYDSEEEGEEEEEEYSYNQEDSAEQDSFDDSLEDTDKTPVVGPEDWRHMTPETHEDVLSNRFEGPSDGPEGSPMPEYGPSTPINARPMALRNDSMNSNGDHRPLPPIPGFERHERSSSLGLSAAAERVSSAQRMLPSPPAPASISKSDLQGMGGGKMSLEERLRLMMLDEENPKTEAELQRERRMRRAGAKTIAPQQSESDGPQLDINEDEDTLPELSGLGEYELPTRISRESILRKINGQSTFNDDSEYNFSTPIPSSSPERPKTLDPDVPLPSTEDTSVLDLSGDSVVVKPEPEDDEVDVYDIPELYQRSHSGQYPSDDNDSILHHDMSHGDGSESHYSEHAMSEGSPQVHSSNSEDEGPPTPRPHSPLPRVESLEPEKDDKHNTLPEFSGFLGQIGNHDFGLGLQSYMTPSPPPFDARAICERAISDEPVPETAVSERAESESADYEKPGSDKADSEGLFLENGDGVVSPPAESELFPADGPITPELQSKPFTTKPEYDGTGWGPDEDGYDEGSTPGSIIHAPATPITHRVDSPAVPEQMATIKAPGSRLKTRPSATPSDLVAMREARRIVSGESNIPPIPDRHQGRSSSVDDPEGLSPADAAGEDYLDAHPSPIRQSSFHKKSLTLDIGSDLGLGLDKDFDRITEAQKVAFSPSSTSTVLHHNSSNAFDFPQLNANLLPRKQRGYLMRQNTKLVVASSDVGKPAADSRGSRSAGNSPVKRDVRPQSWTVEPWNPQRRQKSVRDSAANAHKKHLSAPVPPLPGQASNVTGMDIVAEEEPVHEVTDEETGERGRLFVKVIGVKDLDLPLPKSMHQFFPE